MNEQPPTGRPLRVFYNPRSGIGGNADEAPLLEALHEADVPADARAVAPDGLAAAIADAVDGGATLVGVSGGDGTLLTAANALAGSGATLAPFPSGTLNHFARRLGIDDLAAAAHAVATGETVQVPAGVMDDRLFLNTATFGLYADVVRRRDRWRPALGKWPAAALAFARALLSLRELTVSLEVQGEQITCDTALVWVGVGWGSFPFVHESPDERDLPELEIVVMHPGSRLGALRLLLRMAVALRDRPRLREDPALRFLYARQLVIHARRPIGVTLDGEAMRLRSPIFVGVQPRALSVRAPATTPDARG